MSGMALQVAWWVFAALDDVWFDDVARPGMTWSNCKGAPHLRPHFLLDCSKLERNPLRLEFRSLANLYWECRIFIKIVSGLSWMGLWV